MSIRAEELRGKVVPMPLVCCPDCLTAYDAVTFGALELVGYKNARSDGQVIDKGPVELRRCVCGRDVPLVIDWRWFPDVPSRFCDAVDYAESFPDSPLLARAINASELQPSARKASWLGRLWRKMFGGAAAKESP